MLDAVSIHSGTIQVGNVLFAHYFARVIYRTTTYIIIISQGVVAHPQANLILQAWGRSVADFQSPGPVPIWFAR